MPSSATPEQGTASASVILPLIELDPVPPLELSPNVQKRKRHQANLLVVLHKLLRLPKLILFLCKSTMRLCCLIFSQIAPLTIRRKRAMRGLNKMRLFNMVTSIQYRLPLSNLPVVVHLLLTMPVLNLFDWKCNQKCVLLLPLSSLSYKKSDSSLLRSCLKLICCVRVWLGCNPKRIS